MAVTLSVDELVQQAVEKTKETFKEELRVLQERAWSSGYACADSGESEERNPFSRENYACD